MKKMWITMLALTAAVSLTACGTAAAASASQTSGVAPVASPSGNGSTGLAGNTQSTDIGESAAKEIAFTDAGISAEQVQYLWSKMDYDDGKAVYDVEFVVNGVEYDYEIDAVSGTILSVDQEADNYRAANQTAGTQAASQTSGNAAPQKTTAQSNSTAQTANQGSTAQQNNYIGEQAAQDAALAHAGVSAQNVSFVRTKLDWDNGRWQYEVEFYDQGTEYDYSIDAVTGEVLGYDYDAEYYTANNNTAAMQTAPGAQISAEDAKAIALAHAGVSAQDAQRMEMGFDNEHGRSVYEFEWHVGWTEYSCDVDANTGEVVGYSSEYDD
ncbi:MAG TPA: PepSY domain-containing protein [Candidatus Ruthenibacterium avium]|uniref:PepSY domain-containing protein n=1 Tax=Candidatus Ruthenibacterium avium TaxID=2838751 RepID=A0A9D2M1K8_9FIRM|nr:PepSY domain-containing protein [Candidatus Ruthenibacterium avium]